MGWQEKRVGLGRSDSGCPRLPPLFWLPVEGGGGGGSGV